MARTFTPKVNRHVTYYDASGKPRNATITAVTSNTVVDLRIDRASTIAGATKLSAKPYVSGWRVN